MCPQNEHEQAEVGNRAAGKKFEVSEKHVRDWQKQKSQLQAIPKSKKALQGPKKGANLSMEEALKVWILDQRQLAHAVFGGQIRLRTKSLAKKMGQTSFMASVGWCNRFMRRHNLVIRRKTKIAHKLPEDLEEKLTLFQHFII